MKSKDEIMKIKFAGSQLNRAITYSTYINKKLIYFSICHNKQTSPIVFQIGNMGVPDENNKIFVTMFRNLKNSKFTNTFLQLKSSDPNNKSYDYQNEFIGINRLYEREMFQFTSEKLLLSTLNKQNKKFANNYLLTMGFKVFGCENDLIFYFVQRRCYNAITKTNIIRTAGLQFANQKGLETLDKYFESYENSIVKVNKVPFLNNQEDVIIDGGDDFDGVFEEDFPTQENS